MTPLSSTQVHDKATWEASVARYPEANFLQSWNWGSFHEALGHHVTRLAWTDGTQLVALAQVVREEAKRGTYLTCAGGPLLDWGQPEVAEQVISDLKAVTENQRGWFLRFRPQVTLQPAFTQIAARLNLQPAPMHVTADTTVVVDLTKSSDEMLASFRKSTRYEVKRAEKLGITVRESHDPGEIHTMYEDQLILAKKHGFVPFSYEFWSKQFQALVADRQVALFHAELEGQRLASAFVIFYNGEAVYHYGTSTEANSKLPGSYACQWAIMQAAKARGCTKYNLWGIAPANQPNHRFAGVTTFKTGFSEQVIEYVPAQDAVVAWQYSLVKVFETVRRIMRRL